MCGFVGFLGATSFIQGDMAQSILSRMSSTIASRGPDGFGMWYDEAGIAMAHRRLSILELSEAGAQPMISYCGRFVLAYNGEVYNHKDLRAELESIGQAPVWRGHSDTETILAGVAAWGVKATVERCNGMFAFALWDKAQQVLTLGRDRLGEKPLYYGWQGFGRSASFIFGSELKAFKEHPAFEGNINRDALSLLMRHNCIPAPHSIYQNIFKALPGCLLTVSMKSPQPVVTSYWSLPNVAKEGVSKPFVGTDFEAVDKLESLLRSAISQQMVADVPLGAFLSGGIDSTTVVALMQAQSKRPVKTFTIGFSEEGYNEAKHAQAIAKHLGTEHCELYVTPNQALDVVPQLPKLYCEPFSDSSQIPTFLVASLAREHVTVSLSGDAGDELFAGYNRYVMTENLWGRLSQTPQALRHVAANGIGLLSPNIWNKVLNPLQGLLPNKHRMAGIGDKLHKAANVLGSKSVDELYLGLVSHWDPSEIVIGGQEPLTCLNGGFLNLKGLDDIQKMMALDAITYLPDDILVKVDRAAMGVSLETRVPFLDHRIVEFAWRLPQNFKLREGVGKWALRQVLYRYVPNELIERPKMGFGVPIDSWLRGPLRDWAENLLDEKRLMQEGYFKPAPIRKKWAEHLSGKRNWQHHLWDVLMFQAWLEEQGNTLQ